MGSNNNVREIRTRLSIDGETAFRKSLKSVDSSLSAMKSELKNVSTAFDESTAGMTQNQKKAEILGKMQDTLKGKIGALADAVETSTKEYEDARKKAEELTAEFGEQSDKAKVAWQEVETLGNKMDRMSTMTNNAKSKLYDVTQQLRDLETPLTDADSKTDDAAEAFEDAGKAAEDAGNGGFTIMKGAAADLVSEGLSKVYDSLKDIVTEFGGMDSVYNNFAIKTGASAKEMEGYSESIMSLYEEGYADSLSGVSDSMAVVKQSLGDVPTDKLEEVTEYAITLEETLGYDVAESMRTVNTLVDQFGVTYSDAYDLIVQGAQKGLDQNGDLLDVINEYSVQFKDYGYSAEDMFNMLSNGAAEGVWSIDSLANSFKEFNIKASDGSADEALQALGLGFSESAADAEEMERAAFNVSKAEVDLAKAQAEAADVLAESGENSLEYQEALNNVTQAEYDLADAEAAYNEAANATSYNLDEIKGKLAAGGETAQAAQQQIITALMSVEDENQRYILGQQLMGTMWEDLGEDAIAAMYNTQGEISTTKDAMQEVIDLNYDDIGTRFEKVGRKAKTEIAEPIIEKWMPRIEEGIEWVSDNLDDLVPVVETVGGAMLIAFGVKKAAGLFSGVVSGIKGISSVVTTLTTKTVAQTAAQTALNATNPFGWAVLAVGAVGALAAIAASSAKEYDDMVDHFSELTDAEEEVRKKTEEVVGQYNDWKTAKDTAINEKQTEFNYYDELWDELQGIVDQNGLIKTGYEERAEFITEKLGTVTGEEIKIIDGQIQKYDELTKSIENALLMKKAEAIQGAMGDAYNEAINAVYRSDDENALTVMTTERELLAEQEVQLADAQAEYERLKSLGLNAWSEEVYGTSALAHQNQAAYNEALATAKAEVEGLYNKIYVGNEEQKSQIEIVREAENAYADYIATIENYNTLDTVLDSGGEGVEEALLEMQHGFKDYTQATKEQLEEQTENYKDELKRLKKAIQDGVPGVTQEQVRQMELLVEKSEAEVAKCDSSYYQAIKGGVAAMVRGVKEETPTVESAVTEMLNATLDEMNSEEYANRAGEAGSNIGRTYAQSLVGAIDTLAGNLGMDFTTGFSADGDISSIAAEEARKALINQAKQQGIEIPGFAKGVDNFRGGFAIINENDRGELVNLPDGSQVVPHDISLRYAEEAAARLGAATNNFGGITVQINNPSLSNGQDIKITAEHLSEALISEISRRIDSQKRRNSSAVGR